MQFFNMDNVLDVDLDLELKYLKGNRKFLRAKVTRTCNTISSSIHTFDKNSCLDSIADLKALELKLTKVNDQISKCFCNYDMEEDTLSSEFEVCESYDEKILKTIRRLEKTIDEYADLSTSQLVGPDLSAPSSNGGGQTNRLRLPEIPLPHFYRKNGESLERFLSNFESILNKYSLTEYEKYIFLCKQVHNEALTLIKSLQGTNQIYSEAKKLLEKAFASTVTQKYEIISDLSKLNLTPSGDCYKFIGDMSLIRQSFSSLKISCEDILNYFFWTAMPEKLRLQLTHITNSSKPNLSQIEENIFEAVNRYLSSSSGVKQAQSKDTAVAMAANVVVDTRAESKKVKQCVLCQISNHTINQCKKYDNPRSKVEKLKELGFCVKCGFD